MLFGILLLIIIVALYVLLVQGVLWKLIVGFFGWLGMYWTLISLGATQELVTVSGYSFTWAQVIPTAIILLAMMYMKDD